MTIRVRPAVRADADALATAHTEGWRVGYRELLPDWYLDSPEFSASMRRMWDNWTWNSSGNNALFTAVVDDVAVGFGLIGPSRDDPAEGEVYAMYLSPGAWGSGAAAPLMDACLQWFDERGYGRSVLWVLRDNPRARRFYEKCGWLATERVEEFTPHWEGGRDVPSVTEVQYAIEHDPIPHGSTSSSNLRSMSAAISTEQRGRVLVVTMDDGKVNALSMDTIAAIRAEVAKAAETDGIGAVVLTGREGKFCAGFDLGVMRGDDIQAMADLVAAGGDLVADLYGASVPVVAACNGHALAAGALILLGCDLRIGADVPCKIGLNEVAIGMVLPDWAFTIAGERLSKRHVARAIPLAEIGDAAGACDAGYLDEVVAAEELLDTAVARAEALCDLHSKAYALTVDRMRADLVAKMHEQAANDRRRATVPTV